VAGGVTLGLRLPYDILLQQMLNALQFGSSMPDRLGYPWFGILTMINFAHGDFYDCRILFCFTATFLKLPFIPNYSYLEGEALLGVFD